MAVIYFAVAFALIICGLFLSFREWERAKNVVHFRVAYCPRCRVFPVTCNASCSICGEPVMEMHRHMHIFTGKELAKNG